MGSSIFLRIVNKGEAVFCRESPTIIITQILELCVLTLLLNSSVAMQGNMPDMVLLLQGQNKVLTARLHALAGLLPEPVRQYCTNINRIIMAQEPTTDPLPLLRGLYPAALPEELASVAPGLVGKHLSPEALKMQLVELILEQVFTGQELRHRKWSEVRFSCPVQLLEYGQYSYVESIGLFYISMCGSSICVW